VFKRSLIFLIAGLAFHSLGMVNPALAESKDFKNHLMTMTILYDNNPYDHRLKTAWGFSCLIEFKGKTILFDTGGDGRILLENMKILNKEPKDIDTVILSHIHGDHTGGLESLLREKSNLEIYVPGSFPQDFDRAAEGYGATVARVTAPLEICQGLHSTGEMGHEIKEQSLIINTQNGIVLVTGCAHPGIIEIIEKAKTIARENIYMVIGGWHLFSMGEREIKGIIDVFLRMGIQKVGPCHCTGDLAIAMFKKAYGKNFIQAGVGKIIRLDGPR
jgi:7,8-dihydropterin-6-yl-methyl-4-(beta-D-ribofuranosyl)aminobenzene 5'-phosphate synthase